MTVLNNIGSGFARTAINDNFDIIQDELTNKVIKKVLGNSENNTMEANLDMNSKRILNLPIPLSLNEPARLQDLEDLFGTQGSGITLTQSLNGLRAYVKDLGIYNIKDYGAVGDGSTDNAQAIDDTIADIVSAGGGVFYVPVGEFRTSRVHTLADNMHVQGAGMFQSKIKKTDTASTSTVFSKPDPETFYTRISMDSITLEGNWDVKRREVAGSIVTGRSIREASFTSVRFMHGTGFGLNLNRCIRVLVDQCRFYYICRDACGVWATPQTIVTNNHFNGNDDDCVSLNNESLFGTLDGENIKSACIVANNTLIDTGAIRVQQAKTTIIHANTIQRCKGGSAVNLGSENFGEERMSNPHTCIVTNNVITDIVDRSLSTEIGATANFRIAFKFEAQTSIANVGEPVPVGTIDPATGSIYKPYDSFYTHTQTGNTDSIAPVDTIVFKDNIVKRTLPAVANYSDWGFGTMFTRFATDTFAPSGFVDPEITDTLLECNGVRIEGPVRNFYIQNNVFDHGGIYGVWPILSRLDVSVTDLYWDNVIIENNMFSNFSIGVFLSPFFTGTFQDITVRQNRFNGDPLLKHAGREKVAGANTGGWLSQNQCVAVSASNVKGTKILENEFKNVSVPYLAGSEIRKTIRNRNTFIGQPASGITPNLFSTLNKGIGLFPSEVLDDNSFFVYENSDPRNADYRDYAEQPESYVSGSTPPTYGFFFSGEFVRTRFSTATDGIFVTGFRRKTTGDSHTLGVDWDKVYSIQDPSLITSTPTPPSSVWVTSGNTINAVGSENGIEVRGVAYVVDKIYTVNNRSPLSVYRYTNYSADGMVFTIDPTAAFVYDLLWDETDNTRWIPYNGGIIREYDSTWTTTGRTISVANARGMTRMAGFYWVLNTSNEIVQVSLTTLAPTGVTLTTGLTGLSGISSEGGAIQKLYVLKDNGDVYELNDDGTAIVLILSSGISNAQGLDVTATTMLISNTTSVTEYTNQ